MRKEHNTAWLSRRESLSMNAYEVILVGPDVIDRLKL